MTVRDIAELYYGHMIIGTPTVTDALNVLYDSRGKDGDIPEEFCDREVLGLYPMDSNLLEVCVDELAEEGE